jgi:predicted Zn-dependent peptidase
MKQYIILFSMFLALNTAFGQGLKLGDKPGPLPAKEFAFPKYTELFLSNGLKVFVIEDHEQPTVALRLQIRGGEVSESIPGTAAVVAEMLTKGAGKRDALTIAKELDGVGAGVSASSSGDITNVTGESILKHMPIMLEIFSDVLRSATFPEEELTKLKKQKVSEVKLEKANAGSMLQVMSRKIAYGANHPSARHKSEASYNAITIDEIKKFYSTYFRPNNATLAVVGDVKPEEIKPILEKALGEWTPGEVNEFRTPKAEPMPQGVYFIARPSSVQSATALTGTSVPNNHPDFEALRLGANLMGAGFSGRLFRTLRETYSYTYTPFASQTSGRDVNRYICGADVRNSVTDSAIKVMQSEMTKITTVLAPSDELDLIKRFVIGQFKMSFENSDFVAGLLLNADYNNQPISYVKDFPTRFSAITPEQMKNAMSKHLSKLSIVVVGSPDVLETLKQFGPVYEYTTDFEPKKTEMKKVNLTPEELMEKHRNAMGGLDNISKISTLITSGNASFDMQGQQMQGTMLRKQKAPGKDASVMDLKVFAQKQVTDGNRSWMSIGGQTREVTDPAQKNSMIQNAHILQSTRLLELGNTLKIKGQEGDFIIADLVYASGDKATMFFDAKTFMVDKITSVITSPQGEISLIQRFSNYKAVNGVKFPGKLVIEQNGIIITMDNMVYTVNEPIDDSEFKLD